MRVLSLDIDGVLHPANLSAELHFEAPGPLLCAQAQQQGLLCWAQRLQEALSNHPDINILFHSTWRTRARDRVLSELLDPAIRPQVMVTDMWIEPTVRRCASHSVYIHSTLEAWLDISATARDEVNLCVIDDRPELFEADAEVLQAWRPHFIWAVPERGLSDEDTYAKLLAWADRTGR